MTRPSYTPGSVVRALDSHAARGLIKGWRYKKATVLTTVEKRNYALGLTTDTFRVLVDLTDGESEFELRSLREAYVFVAGLASAHHAQLRASS